MSKTYRNEVTERTSIKTKMTPWTPRKILVKTRALGSS